MQNFQAWSKHKMATGKHLQIKEICLGARVLAAGHGRFAVWLDLAHDVEEAGLTSCKHDMTFICTVFPAHFALRFSSRLLKVQPPTLSGKCGPDAVVWFPREVQQLFLCGVGNGPVVGLFHLR